MACANLIVQALAVAIAFDKLVRYVTAPSFSQIAVPWSVNLSSWSLLNIQFELYFWARVLEKIANAITPNSNKKAVLSQRWPRDARYISRSWAVAEIWPFEIIQDGGGRHLEFIRIENSAIRSAVPENPTL